MVAFSKFGKSAEIMSMQEKPSHLNNRLDSAEEENDTRHYSRWRTLFADYTFRSFHANVTGPALIYRIFFPSASGIQNT